MTDAAIQERPQVGNAARYAYGGVAFEVLPKAGGEWTLAEDHRLFLDRLDGPVCGHVTVAVTTDPTLAPRTSRAITWQWDGDRAIVTTKGVVAHLQRLKAGRWVAAARVDDSVSASSSLTTALAGVILGREGGLVLHAAGIVMNGASVLFIGPSGAGKTTAANHCRGAAWHARDRAAVFPWGGRWWSCGMAGGDDINLPHAPRATYPLAGIARVRRGRSKVELDRLEPLRAIAVLRESTQWNEGCLEDEERVLDACSVLAREARIIELRSVLEHDLSPVIANAFATRAG